MALASGDWAWAGVFASVILLYMFGVALGLGYLRIESRVMRWGLALGLAASFVALDVLLVEALPDADPAVRSLLASCSAVPLGLQYALTKKRTGMPASAMTSNLARIVDMMVNRNADALDGAAAAHQRMLVVVMPLFFTAGAICGVEIERNVSYALSVLAPLFALGTYVTDSAPHLEGASEELDGATTAATVPLTRTTPTAARLCFVLDL